MADNFFYGLEGQNLFKVYVSDAALHGAKIGNHIYNAETARATTIHFGLLGLLLSSFIVKRAVNKRAEAEAKYDALDPGSPPFREGDKANFSLGANDIHSATITPKPGGFKGAFSSGPTIELALHTGKKRKFVLIENQNLGFVKNLVARAIPMTTLVEG